MVILILFILVRRDFPHALHDSAAKTLTIRTDQAIQSALLTEVICTASFPTDTYIHVHTHTHTHTTHTLTAAVNRFGNRRQMSVIT